MENFYMPGKFRFIDPKGRKITCFKNQPEFPKQCLIMQHGFAEHCRVYFPVMEWLERHQVAVLMMDLPGHGTSDGVRGHIDDFQDYLNNMEILFGHIPREWQKLPTYMFGHSLGGLISALYAIEKQSYLKGVILSSPLTGFPKPEQYIISMIADIVSIKSMNQPVIKPVSPDKLTRDPKKWIKYYSDPFRGHMITPRMFNQMRRKCTKIQHIARELELPVLMFQGAQDQVVSPEEGYKFFDKISSEQKKLVVFSKAVHELFQEKEADHILKIMLDWLQQKED